MCFALSQHLCSPEETMFLQVYISIFLARPLLPGQLHVSCQDYSWTLRYRVSRQEDSVDTERWPDSVWDSSREEVSASRNYLDQTLLQFARSRSLSLSLCWPAITSRLLWLWQFLWDFSFPNRMVKTDGFKTDPPGKEKICHSSTRWHDCEQRQAFLCELKTRR